MRDGRIDTCLDERAAKDLQFSREVLGGKSKTEVLQYSLQQAAKGLREKSQARKQKDIWKSSGLIGCISPDHP
ncbi:MAG TPA: hypothetical protein DD979_03310 [Gammaproteobacteria bacterium]|jgi:hypothetical protein|nr:hypothetical protein [Gammaproteobacteria bacterium]